MPRFLARPAVKGEVLLLSLLNVAILLLAGWLMAKAILPMLALAFAIGALTYVLGRFFTRPRSLAL
jgi:hypothetical protein